MPVFRIAPSQLKGKLLVPPSKSHTLRALLFGLMGKGTTCIRNYLKSPDTLAMCEAIRLLGAHVTVQEDQILIEGVDGNLQSATNVIDAGNSGQVLRFVGALAALLPTYTVLTGDDSIRSRRPAEALLHGLKQLGALAESTCLNGYAPLLIKGPIQPGRASLCGADSQPVSGLLIATSFLKGKTELFVDHPGEKPWIDLTLSWMKKLNLQVENYGYTHYIVHGNGHYEGFDVTIPGDFSSAAFPIAAALVTNSELTLDNLDMTDCQGDKKLIDLLIKMGARIEIDDEHKQLNIKKSPPLQGMQLDINDCVDALTILAVIGCFAKGTTQITNAAIARHKESDRIHNICTQLKKMGACIEERPDGLIVSHSPLQSACVQSHSDHRLAMSLCVAALGAQGESEIEGTECIAKTFPTFAKSLIQLGAEIKVHS